MNDNLKTEKLMRQVCVVIPCYNAALFLARAIESVITGQNVDVRVIAIDDGSTDDTASVLTQFDDSVTWESGPNRGACAARNRGLALTDCPYVMFLDADDYLEPGTLAGLVEALEIERADLAIAPLVSADSTGRQESCPGPRCGKAADFVVDWVSGRFVPPCGILWRTETVKALGGWNEALRKNQDGDLVLRSVLSGAQVVASDAGAAVYWSHDSDDRISNTISESKLRDSFDVLLKARSKLVEIGQISSETEKAFSLSTHSLERMAARHGLTVIEREIRTFRILQGWPKFEGARVHIVGSRLLGLGKKERVAKWLRQRLEMTKRSGST